MQEQVGILDERWLDISESFGQDLTNQFEYASGSIIGRNHVLAGKNNQDAYQIVKQEKFITAVVCDGCGSGKHSEVGAKLGANLVINAIADLLNQSPDRDLEISKPEFWDSVKINLLQKLKDLVALSNGDLEFVNEYLLFTILGSVITSSETVTFSMGDGAIAINSKFTEIPPYADNAPPYLAYGLYKPEAINFEIRDRLPTSELESLLIATDGIDDLVKVETITQFWQEARYFKNPDAIRRKLATLNREETKPDWNKRELIKRSGVLSDDTSLVVIRRVLGVSC
ncbi:protein phosphatase 2C domain-containing protein [Pseudanabaena sp. UWO310]|uniref:protein phosphatase 2C domain-containing protein n=1 Tax=Pseudanabaena sp. UWO310 TaxID=2480795 RepID=UPI0011581375|nr:protein phosphatase 2C domain-containing protein [Pseudanabaena sp. UWO310]TYQ28482.1 protein phosphatase 2C domain-containing protein [Pseudanabaena sp. UWO310]